MKATLFMISDAANTPGFVSTEQMRQMEAGGFDIQGHTNHHKILTKMILPNYRMLFLVGRLLWRGFWVSLLVSSISWWV